MSFLQDDTMDAVLDSIFGSGSPATYYIALFTTNPVPAGTGGVEAAYTDYARFVVTNNPTEFPNASAGAKSNANDWDFGIAGSGPTTIVGIGFYDDPTSVLPANLYAVVDVTGSSIIVNNGADVVIPATGLDLTRCA